MSPSSPVVTRFAPSPTGFLHIGGARTALFNWLYAKRYNGRFLIRIEDTDRERSTEAAVGAIFEGLSWLGLEADGEITFQFARSNRHREAAEQLLTAGHAYRCYMTSEELEREREAAKVEGRRLTSPWRDPATPPREGEPFVVRFKGPERGRISVKDLVQGQVDWDASVFDDLILLRSDGGPTYNLAVIVDDHDMGVTHVIRGDDHLNNAARQSLIYDAFGWQRPQFGHIPLIHGPDGAKLSKRHGAQAVGDFAKLGYLPEAMRNYLARLGWSHGDDEIFTDAQAQSWFDICDVNRAPARLDFDKLNHINGHWLHIAEDARLLSLLKVDFLGEHVNLTEAEAAALARAVPLVKDRAKTLVDLAQQVSFALAKRPLDLDDKTKSALAGDGGDRMRRLTLALKALANWDVDNLDAALKSFAADEGVGFGKVGPILRGVLTGGRPAPDLAKALFALGKPEALARLNDALS